MTQAWSYIGGLFDMSLFNAPNFRSLGMCFIEISYTIFFIVLLQLIDWIQRKRDFGLEISNIKYRAIRWGIYISFVFIFTKFSGNQEQFIYFQF